MDVSFFGYINKFYTSEPFQFSAQARLKEKLNSIVEKKPWKCDPAINQVYQSKGFLALKNHSLLSLIDQNLLTIRTLDQSPNYMPDERLTIIPSAVFKRGFPAFVFDFYVYIDYLRSFYHNLDILKKQLLALSAAYAADHLADKSFQGPDKDFLDKYVASICLVFLLPSKIVFNNNRSEKVNEEGRRFHLGEGIHVNYELIEQDHPPNYHQPEVNNIVHISGATVQSVDLDIFTLLVKTLETCIEKGIIR